MTRRSDRGLAALPALLLATSLAGGTARAGDPLEFWPEVNAFVRLAPPVRFYGGVAYSMGKESPGRTVDMAGHFDISLKPILRPVRRQEDWARNRYLWTRLGYDHIFTAEGGDRNASEERGIVSLYAKDELAGQVWLEGRVREDLRWRYGDFSTRHRLRLEATREFTPFRYPVTPYLNSEWFYDTRYDGWSRVLVMAGSEVTLSPHFRFEMYLARQKDLLPEESGLYAGGLVAKLYY